MIDLKRLQEDFGSDLMWEFCCKKVEEEGRKKKRSWVVKCKLFEKERKKKEKRERKKGEGNSSLSWDSFVSSFGITEDSIEDAPLKNINRKGSSGSTNRLLFSLLNGWWKKFWSVQFFETLELGYFWRYSYNGIPRNVADLWPKLKDLSNFIWIEVLQEEWYRSFRLVKLNISMGSSSKRLSWSSLVDIWQSIFIKERSKDGLLKHLRVEVNEKKKKNGKKKEKSCCSRKRRTGKWVEREGQFLRGVM